MRLNKMKQIKLVVK